MSSHICLDIAVDHRIKLLCKPTNISETENSRHVEDIKERGRLLGRSEAEIDVTAQLAGPSKKGGIAVMLQQPRTYHPFEDGIEEVVNDCDTLYAIQDAFDLVSCTTLDIRKNVAVIDLMPYVSDTVSTMKDANLRAAFKPAVEAIAEMEPDVLLCAGRIWFSDWTRLDNRKGEAWKLESIGLGEVFGNTPKRPVNVRIRNGQHGLVSVSKVNGSHPSYAINRNPHVSILRQLQILTIAEACGTYRGDWEEEKWMADLRSHCKEKNTDELMSSKE